MAHVPDIKLIRTDTTLDLSQKAEKGMDCTKPTLRILTFSREVFGIGSEGIVHHCLAMAMYIRVKRMKTTYFIQCDPTETVLDVKQKMFALIEQPVSNQRLILMSTEEVLEDSKSLAEQKVENDAVVALTLRKDDNEFEDVNIPQPTDFSIS
ncbi:Serine/threonine-protein kinase ZRK7 [Cardamine amara subsp. amara]|uniref:Serine/threonine-protein kinase ZRK7 n=1 Tax=Cardamine amara subsp. amara TaxID=228776 RepID=A0ABD1BK22_CARAN